MISWPRDAVLQACQKYAPLLPDMDGVDPARLLAAVAMMESSLGANCGPRHEPAWDIGGEYASDPQQTKNLELYPYAAACSYGPLQILFYNCPGYSPTELNTDLNSVMRASVAFMSKQIQRFGLFTVEGIAEVWNHGSPVRPPAEPSKELLDYCNDVAGYYIAAEEWVEEPSTAG